MGAIKDGVKEVLKLDNCSHVGTCKLYPFDLIHLDPILKSHFQFDVEVVGAVVDSLDEMALAVQADSLLYLHRGQVVYSVNLQGQV